VDRNERIHRAIVAKARASGWTERASDVLDMADMLVAYLSEERCKRKGIEGRPENGHYYTGLWKRNPYGQAIRRAMSLLAIRRGQKGKMRLPANWKERIREAGIDWERMEVIEGERLKWARAWKQFLEYDGFKLDRQRTWNAIGEPAAWPPPVIGWEARANSKVMRGKREKERTEERKEAPSGGFDVTKGFRKRVSMRVEQG
jgi:hypothetical protein